MRSTVAGQLSPRWNKPSGSGMRQEVFRASITEIESRQFAELIFDSSLSHEIVLPFSRHLCYADDSQFHRSPEGATSTFAEGSCQNAP